jgi:hypothetical protein
MEEVARAIDQPGHLFLAEHGGQPLRAFGRRQIFALIRPSQRLDEKNRSAEMRPTMMLTASFRSFTR